MGGVASAKDTASSIVMAAPAVQAASKATAVSIARPAARLASTRAGSMLSTDDTARRSAPQAKVSQHRQAFVEKPARLLIFVTEPCDLSETAQRACRPVGVALRALHAQTLLMQSPGGRVVTAPRRLSTQRMECPVRVESIPRATGNRQASAPDYVSRGALVFCLSIAAERDQRLRDSSLIVQVAPQAKRLAQLCIGLRGVALIGREPPRGAERPGQSVCRCRWSR
jgi:hypothetical protein